MESVINQSYPVNEIVIVDDYSLYQTPLKESASRDLWLPNSLEDAVVYDAIF